MEAKWRRGYPKISLEEAIEKVGQVYQKEYNHPAPREVIAAAMNYKGISGASSRILSALSQYGLLEHVGEDLYRVSDDALNLILHQRGEMERIQSVKRLASNPNLFEAISERFPNTVPSDDNLRAFLIKSGYHPSAVKDIIDSYKETLRFVDLETRQFASDGEVKESPDIRASDDTKSQTVRAETIFEESVDSGNSAPLIFKISRTSTARVQFTGNVSQEAIGKLINLLELSLDTYPTESEVKEV